MDKEIQQLKERIKKLEQNQIAVIMTDNADRNLFRSVMRTLSQKNVALGIGTSSPNPAAILDLSSVHQVFLPPRMTTAQRDAIASVPDGAVIFNVTTGVLNFYNSGWSAV